MNLTEIYRGLYDDLCHYAYTILKDEAVCHDIVQEVFVKIVHKGSLKSIDSFKPYLYKAVCNTSLNYIRNEKKKQLGNSEYSYLRDNTENDVLDESQIQKVIETVLEELPKTCKLVFLYAKRDSLRYKDIADKMNISVKTVESHMSVALKKIKNYLEKNKNISWSVLFILLLISYEY